LRRKANVCQSTAVLLAGAILLFSAVARAAEGEIARACGFICVREIGAARFYKRPSMWRVRCYFLPVCPQGRKKDRRNFGESKLIVKVSTPASLARCWLFLRLRRCG
jgi:hypothetical protein